MNNVQQTSPMGHQLVNAPSQRFRRKDEGRNLTDSERRAVYDALLLRCDREKPRHGSMQAVAMEYGICSETVNRIWKRGQQSLAAGSVVADVDSKRKGKCGRKQKHDRSQLEQSKILHTISAKP
ncbi:hypothetical protein AC1031_021898 [Aphanomyces cochlioides]|nr:hypothetical protein AC1031_021898 [Aphanomyces cochlioides]